MSNTDLDQELQALFNGEAPQEVAPAVEEAPRRRRRTRQEIERDEAEAASPIVIVEAPKEEIIPVSPQTLAEMEAGRQVLMRFKGAR